MTDWTRRTLIQSLLAVPAVQCAQATPATEPWRKSAFESLSAFVEDRVVSKQSVGFALGISAPDFRKMTYFGAARLQTAEPVTSSTKFRIASISKPITAACVLDLCERGALSLDTTLDTFFPDFPRAGEITIYHLLAHTSGLANWWGRLPDDATADFMDKPAPHKVIMRMESPFLFAPGTMRSYSNTGYILLGEIIEFITRTPFEVWLDEALLSRCGAGGIELERSGSWRIDWATGYTGTPGSAVTTQTAMPFAAGGLRSNLHDTLAFFDALFHGPLISFSSRTLMVEQARVNDGRLVQDATFSSREAPAEPWPDGVSEFGYGLGINTWVQSGERFYSHAGLIDGFSAYLIHAPRTQTTVVALSNSQTGTTGIGQRIRDFMIQA